MIIHMMQLSNRKLNRKAWKEYYRKTRIINRESMKAMSDVLMYGRGFARVSAEGVEHIPFKDAIILDDIHEAPQTPEQKAATLKWFDEILDKRQANPIQSYNFRWEDFLK